MLHATAPGERTSAVLCTAKLTLPPWQPAPKSGSIYWPFRPCASGAVSRSGHAKRNRLANPSSTES